MTGGPLLPVPVADPESGRLLVIRDRALAFDAAFGISMAVLTSLPYVTSDRAVMLAGVSLGGCLVIRRIWPLVSLIVAAVTCLAVLVLYDSMFTAIVIVPVLVYSAARWAPTPRARLALALGLAGSVLGPARWFSQSPSFTLAGQAAYVGMGVVACVGIIGGVYLIGRRRKDSLAQRDYRRQTQAEQQRLLISEQEQRARAAATDERNRIARELHDIVAHSLSVIVVQAEGAKALARKKPERAPEVLETIADTSREALAEMRRMVGLLRSGTPADENAPSDENYIPTPGLDDLATLVRRSSDRATLTVFGPVPVVSQALGLTVYRIVQESLTNVLKHAGPQAHAQVTLTYAADQIEVEVVDDGRGASAQSDGLGHGLQGMNERVLLHAGRVSARPRSGGGFVVHAVLPVPAGATPDHGRRDVPPDPYRVDRLHRDHRSTGPREGVRR